MIKIIDIRNEDNFEVETKRQDIPKDIMASVEKILFDVKERGDEALREYTAKFDGVNIENFEVAKEEISEANLLIEDSFKEVLKAAAENISSYHKKQLKTGYTLEKNGIVMGQRITPIETVGIYIPGGTAAYPSTVLMDVIPAVIAGVKNIYIATPPMPNGKINPSILVATSEASGASGVRIFKVGGAQAIGAFCYGTKSIPKVDLIVGPGNIYVAAAKKAVYGLVGIDMIAGPSDILVIADSSANPSFVAADLLSQAEHDTNSSSILITNDSNLAYEVADLIEEQLGELERREIAEQSIKDNGRIYIVKDLTQAVDVANQIAPEHLELSVENQFMWLEKIKNAGSIFLGNYTPEALGDYFAGPNHTLPTMGTARFTSPLSVDTFQKKSSYLSYSKRALSKDATAIEQFALHEGLGAHANSITIRSKKDVKVSK